MDRKTVIAFVTKLLEDTQSNTIKWKVAEKSNIYIPFPNTSYSYTATTSKGTVLLGKPTYDSSDYSLYVIPNSGPTYDLSDLVSWYDNDVRKQYVQSLQKLYSCVYNSLPNVDTFIGSFLQN